MFAIDRKDNQLFYDDRVYTPSTCEWQPVTLPIDAEQVDSIAAMAWLQKDSGFPIKTPVAIIGPNEAMANEAKVAFEVGALVSRMGLAVLCGGRGGVMESASKGAASEAGLVIGLLPRNDPKEANPYVSVIIASGIGEARNAIIAQAASCLIAIGDSYGTLSEVALGLRLGKRVFGLAGAAQIEGVVQLDGATALPAALAQYLFRV